jgi:magnesium-transporting ATPase (P-type)
MDSMGSLALSTEPPDDGLLRRKPYPRNEYIINYLMWKHILVQAVVQFIILIILYTSADKFIYEDNNDRITTIGQILSCFGIIPATSINISDINSIPNRDSLNILSGRSIDWKASIKQISNLTCQNTDFKNSSSLAYAFDDYTANFGNTVHMTIIFNTFVLYTLFNQLNSRMINDEKNIFHSLQNNIYFVIILIIEIAFQILIISVGSKAFNCSNGGLTGKQWGICIGFGLICFPVSFILKYIPLEKCLEYTSLYFRNLNCCKKGNKVDNADSMSSEADEKDLITKRKLKSKDGKTKKSKGKKSEIILDQEKLKE